MFLQQGASKLPVTEATAEAFGLPYIVWWFVTYGELGSGIGLIVGGFLGFKDHIGLGDVITRFSGITMACIMTGVIWISAPKDLMTVLLYDYLHVSLYFGGLYFALRGNAKWTA
jgi:putative oxidoreductase